jgi:hypothetical protein
LIPLEELHRMKTTFHGDWKIDAAQSKVWDYQTGRYAPDDVGEELISIRIAGDVQDYEVLLGDRPTVRMGYTTRYDDPEWKPYAVREILGLSEPDADQELQEFQSRIRSGPGFRIGALYGLVRSVYVDERTHYRLSKNVDGVAEYVMLRRLAGDGQSYVATVLRTDGTISRVRTFTRVG